MQLTLDYHNILFPYLTKDKPNINMLRENPTKEIVSLFCNEHSNKSPFDQQSALEFLLALQLRLETKAKEIIEKKSINYWFHLYRRIGPQVSFGESKQTIALYRNMLETAFVKYGNKSSGKELVKSGGNTYVRDEKIASGFYQKACKETFGDMYEPSKRNTGVFLGEFGFADLVEIYSLERLMFEYWHTTSCFRRVSKGGVLKIEGEDYFADADQDTEYLMTSYDNRGGSFQDISSYAGLMLVPDVHKNKSGITLLPKYNFEGLSIDDYPQHLGFGISDKEFSKAEEFVPNFLWLPFDYNYYYQIHAFMEETFKLKYGYSLKGFVYSLYLLSMQTIEFCLIDKVNGKYAVLELLKRGYRHFGLLDSLIYNLLSLKDRYKLSAIGDYNLTFEEIELIFRSLFLDPENRVDINLRTMGPKKLFLPTSNHGFIVDYAAVLQLLLTHTNLQKLDDNEKGHLFEAAVIEKLSSKNFELWESQKEITHFDGTSKEIDISFMYKNLLFIGELKSNRMSIAFSALGDQKSLEYRKMKATQALDQVDVKAAWLSSRRKGTNYEIPAQIDTIIPIVVTPFTEYIWSKEESFWLTDEVPRICLQSELVHILNEESIQKIQTKPFAKMITN